MSGRLVRRRGPRAVLLVLGVFALAQGSSAGAPAERALSGDLVGKFVFGPCPEGAPTGARCLHDSVSGPISYLGASTGEFDVVLDVAASGPDGCAPASKSGVFVASDGDRLNVTAQGRYCFATSATNYAYTVKGGTGRFADATGRGEWDVPAPRSFSGSSGEGDEHLRGTIAFTEPTPGSPDKSRGRLRLGRIVGRPHHERVRASVFSNRHGLHRVVVAIRRGSPSGRVLGKSRRFTVADRRVVGVRLRRPLRCGVRYVAVAVGYDRAGNRVSAVRYFRPVR